MHKENNTTRKGQHRKKLTYRDGVSCVEQKNCSVTLLMRVTEDDGKQVPRARVPQVYKALNTRRPECWQKERINE